MTPSKRTPHRTARPRWRPWLVAAAVAGVVLASVATFWPVRESLFLQDDHPIVQINPVVREGDLRTIFGTDWWGGVGGSDASLYRPITVLSFALQRRDGAVPPETAHWANVLLHALASILLAIYARRIGARRRASWVAGALFLVHPVHVSVVAGLVGRAEILSLLFGLAALLSQSAADRWPGSTTELPAWMRAFAPWTTAVFLFLALGSKESAVAFPVLLLLQEVVLRPPQRRNAIAEWRMRIRALLPAGIAALGYVSLRWAVLGSPWSTQRVRISENPLVEADGWERVFTTLAVAGRYARLLVYPRTLSPDYSGNVVTRETGLLSAYPLAGLALLAGFTAILLIAWRARRRQSEEVSPGTTSALTIGSALFLLPYLVIGQIVVLVGVVMAERLIYVPSAGFCVLAGIGVCAAWRPAPRPLRAVLAAAIGALLVVAAVKTHREARNWKNSETLFEAAVRATPDSPRAQFTLGKIRLDQGRADEALALFEETLRLWPQFSSAWYEKGMILARRGLLAEAEEALARAAEINPWNVAAQVNYGIVLHRLGKLEAAESQLRATLESYPGSDTAAAELGHVLLESGRPGEAAAWYRRAMEFGRTDLESHFHAAEARARAEGEAVPSPPPPR